MTGAHVGVRCTRIRERYFVTSTGTWIVARGRIVRVRGATTCERSGATGRSRRPGLDVRETWSPS